MYNFEIGKDFLKSKQIKKKENIIYHIKINNKLSKTL